MAPEDVQIHTLEKVHAHFLKCAINVFWLFFLFCFLRLDEWRNDCRPRFTITEFAVCFKKSTFKLCSVTFHQWLFRISVIRFFDCQSNQYQPWQNHIWSAPHVWVHDHTSCWGFHGNINMDSGGSSSVTRMLSCALSAPWMDYWRQWILVQQLNKEMPPMCNLLVFLCFFSLSCRRTCARAESSYAVTKLSMCITTNTPSKESAFLLWVSFCGLMDLTWFKWGARTKNATTKERLENNIRSYDFEEGAIDLFSLSLCSLQTFFPWY